MLTQAKEVVDAWRASQRTLDIKVLVNGTTYTARDINSLKYDSGAYTGETFAIGSTYSNSVQIEFSHLVEGLKLGMKVLPSIGIKTAKGYVYEPLGVFVISNEIKMDRNNNLTTISASDQFCGLEGMYESSLSYPAKMLDVITEVCAKAGVKVNTGDLARLPKQPDLPTPITGQSYRKALGWIAQLYVGYALFDRQGLFTIRTIAEPNYELDPSQYEQAGLVKNEATYKIGGIQCQTTITTETRDGEKTETTQTYQAGSSSGAQIKLENNIMTVERLNDIWERLKDLNFYPFSLNWFGNPAIEAGDWLKLKDKQGNSFVVPNNSYTLDFNGGLSAVSKADQTSSSAQAIGWSGSVMQAIKELQVRNAPDGTVIYPTTVTSPPENAKVNDIWFKKNGNDTELWVYEKQDDGSGVWKRNDLANDEIKKQIEEQQTALEEARSKADQAYHSAENAHLTADAIYKDFMSVQTDMSTQIADASQKAQETADNHTKMKHQVDSDLNALAKVTDNLTSNVGKLTTDVNGVKGQYATLDGRISEFSAGLEGVNAQLKDAKRQLATVKLTADSAAANFSSAKGDIASLKTKANEIEQQMLSKVGNDVFESFRASTAQELRSKLTTTDLNGYVRTSEFTHTADSLKANITTIGDQINNLDVGGRNLLKQSQLGSSYLHDAWYEAFGGVTWNSDTVELNVGDKDCVQIEQRVYDAEPDTDYVFSFDLNYADGQHPDKQGFIFLEFKDRECKQTTSVYKDNWTNMAQLPNTPGRRDKKIVIHTQPDTHTIIFMVRSLKGAKLPFRLSKVKLEKGNKPTDWSPAPEDFSEQLTAVNNTLQLYNTEFNLLKDGMTLRINEINKINDRISGLKVGGRNYLQGSLDFTWPTGIGRVNVTPTFEMQRDIKVVHLNSRDFGGIYTKWGGAFPNGELQVGDDYTLSFDAKGSGVFKTVKNESEAGDGSLAGTSLTSDWKRYSVSGKINSLNKAYVIYFNGGYDAYIRHVKIEKGNKPTDYTQAPEDIAKQLSKVDDTLKSQSLDLKVLKDGMRLRINEINSVNDRFNNLMIGGTNLLDRTSSEARSNDAPTTGWIEGAAYNTLDALTESRYVLSFEARGDVNGQRIGTFLWHGGLGGRNISKKSTTSQGGTFTAGDGQSFVMLTTQWQRYWVLYEVNPDNTRKTAIVGRRWADSKPNGKVYVRKVKLESGDKATDWSPAPEDTAKQLLNVGNTLKTYQTELNVLKDGMTFRTSEIARVNDRIDKLGIQNLVYNSEFSNNAEGWTNIGSNAAGTILFSNNEWDSWQGSNGLAFRTLSTSTSSLLSQSKRFKVLNWQRISASVQLHVTDNITNSCDAGMEIVFYPDEASGNEIKRVSQVTSRVNNISNGFAKLLYVNDVEVPANAKFATLRLWTYRVGNIIFNQPMVTFNSSYLPYARDNKSLGVLSEKYAALDVKVNGINSVVANKADVSYVDQRANQWKLELTGLVIGGTNLVPLTNQGVRDLYVENKFGQMSYTEKRIYGVRGININNTSPAPSNGWFVIGKNVTLSKFKPDTDYVISFNLRGDTSIRAYAMIDIRGTNAQNSISVGDPGYNLNLEAGRICKIEKKIHTATSFTDVGQVLYINCIELSRVRNLELWDLKIEQGNKATAWSPAPEDNMAAITAVRNELNTAINLRVQKGELLSQINMQAGHTLIQSNKIYLDSESVVFSGKAFIPNAAIASLSADKINGGTINGRNVNVINLNANNITSGSISGTNLNINLDSGYVSFQKGKLHNFDRTVEIDLDNNYISTADWAGRIMFKGGSIQIVQPSLFDKSSNPYLEISNSVGSGSFHGGVIKGRDNIVITNSANSSTFFLTGGLGQSTFAGLFVGQSDYAGWQPTVLSGADRGVYIVGGKKMPSTNNIFDPSRPLITGSPFINIGTDSNGKGSWGIEYILKVITSIYLARIEKQAVEVVM